MSHTQRLTRCLVGGVAIAALAAALLGAGLLAIHLGGGLEATALRSPGSLSARQTRFLNQLRADSRTFVSAMRFLLDNRSTPLTNATPVATNLTLSHFDRPTNLVLN